MNKIFSVKSYEQLEAELFSAEKQVEFYRSELENLIGQYAKVAAAEREVCAKTIERARLDMDGSLGLTHETDFIATRITDFLAARIRAMRQI